jgi:hypothetical protein
VTGAAWLGSLDTKRLSLRQIHRGEGRLNGLVQSHLRVDGLPLQPLVFALSGELDRAFHMIAFVGLKAVQQQREKVFAVFHGESKQPGIGSCCISNGLLPGRYDVNPAVVKLPRDCPECLFMAISRFGSADGDALAPLSAALLSLLDFYNNDQPSVLDQTDTVWLLSDQGSTDFLAGRGNLRYSAPHSRRHRSADAT